MVKTRSIMEDGRQRRSARLSALDKWHEERVTRGVVHKVKKRAGDKKAAGKGQGLPGKKRGRKKKKKKKKLREVKEVVVNSIEKDNDDDNDVQAGQNLKQEDHRNDADKLPCNAFCMPEKRVLELILNVLQKKDTHEIFAEPVNSDEVEGYYDIIKEPMDFGTMRAKLHEGLYKTLEQFESDVYLICNNAMHFNASSTVFFRLARSILELAKKTFHALRTDPENFESEFSSTRRRYYLKKAVENHVIGSSPADAGNSDSHTCVKPATSVKSSNLITTSVLKDTGKLLQSHLGQRDLQESPLSSRTTSVADSKRNCENISGVRDGRKSYFAEEERRSAERRSSCRSRFSLLSSNESLGSVTSYGPRQLCYVNPGNFSYAESLLLFVKDLGPTAKAVAYRKLQKCQMQNRNCQSPVVPQSNVIGAASKHVDNTATSNHPNANVDCNTSSGSREMHSQKQIGEAPSTSSPATRLGNLDIPATTILGSRFPVNTTQASEFSQSRLLESMLRNSNMVGTHPWPYHALKSGSSGQVDESRHSSSAHSFGEGNQVAAVVAQELNHRLVSAQTGISDFRAPQAVLNMSYLQAKLGELNTWGQKATSALELPPASVSESKCVGDCERDVGHSLRTELSNQASFEKQPDLALQL